MERIGTDGEKGKGKIGAPYKYFEKWSEHVSGDCQQCSKYPPKISIYPIKLSKYLAITVISTISFTQKEEMFQLL